MEMIYCGSGNYAYGDDNVRLRMDHGFWMGKYEVTQAQWKSVMKDSPARWKGDDLPVECVTWDECQEFLKRVNEQLDCGARMPTEHEWEYACRAGTGTPLNNGTSYTGTTDTDKTLANVVAWTSWNRDNTLRRLSQPVGKKAPNAWGLYDMLGNVYEACRDQLSTGSAYTNTFTADWDDPESPSVTTNPVGRTASSSITGWIRRGGAALYDGEESRSAMRQGYTFILKSLSPDNCFWGYRLVVPIGDVLK